MTIKHGGLDVSWLGYMTVRIEPPDGFVVYLGPSRCGVLDDCYARSGDLALVTHSHHYDSNAIEQVADTDAAVVTFEGVDAAAIDCDVVSVGDLPYGTVRMDEKTHLIVGKIDVQLLSAFNDSDGSYPRDGDVVRP